LAVLLHFLCPDLRICIWITTFLMHVKKKLSFVHSTFFLRWSYIELLRGHFWKVCNFGSNVSSGWDQLSFCTSNWWPQAKWTQIYVDITRVLILRSLDLSFTHDTVLSWSHDLSIPKGSWSACSCFTCPYKGLHAVTCYPVIFLCA